MGLQPLGYALALACSSLSTTHYPLFFLSTPSTLQNPPNPHPTNHFPHKNTWHTSFPPTRIIKVVIKTQRPGRVPHPRRTVSSCGRPGSPASLLAGVERGVSFAVANDLPLPVFAGCPHIRGPRRACSLGWFSHGWGGRVFAFNSQLTTVFRAFAFRPQPPRRSHDLDLT